MVCNSTFYMIFAVFDVLLTCISPLTLCINFGFYIYRPCPIYNITMLRSCIVTDTDQ